MIYQNDCQRIQYAADKLFKAINEVDRALLALNGSVSIPPRLEKDLTVVKDQLAVISQKLGGC